MPKNLANSKDETGGKMYKAGKIYTYIKYKNYSKNISDKGY